MALPQEGQADLWDVRRGAPLLRVLYRCDGSDTDATGWVDPGFAEVEPLDPKDAEALASAFGISELELRTTDGLLAQRCHFHRHGLLRLSGATFVPKA